LQILHGEEAQMNYPILRHALTSSPQGKYIDCRAHTALSRNRVWPQEGHQGVWGSSVYQPRAHWGQRSNITKGEWGDRASAF